jgi:hypothetical protein
MADLTKLSTDQLDAVTRNAKSEYDTAHDLEIDARRIANAARREVTRAAGVRHSKGRFWNQCREEQTRRENILNNVGR